MQHLWLPQAGLPVTLHVLELGLACCGIEVREARRLIAEAGGLERPTQEAPGAESPAPLNVLVVAGTVTTPLAPLLVEALSALPTPRAVLAFGACAATGGPYWDSYAVLPGAHEVIGVDGWVAGCPPRPADLLAGLEEVAHAALGAGRAVR